MIIIKSEEEIRNIKVAGEILRDTHIKLEEAIRPGMSTYELDQIAEKYILSKNAIPAQKGYPNFNEGMPSFPSTTCISVNNEVIHGIPSKKRILKDGDIVSIDLVVEKNGYFADAARTYIVGKANSKEDENLVKTTKEAFFKGIKYAKVGYRIGDISNAIYEHVKKNNLDVIRAFQGHGVGVEMHEEPGIPNYGEKGRGPRLEEGMILAIEPMVVQGDPDIIELDDGWTILTSDGKNSAHYENTVLITKNEPEILTI